MSKEVATKRFFSNAGSQWADNHAIRIDDNGHKTLAKTGEKTNIYEKIKSHDMEVDIFEILKRCDAEGYQILDAAKVIEGDVTAVPKSMMEAQILLQEQENTFNHLPLDVRKQFNFSFTEYIAEAGKDLKAWSTKMGFEEKPSLYPTKEVPTETPKEGG